MEVIGHDDIVPDVDTAESLQAAHEGDKFSASKERPSEMAKMKLPSTTLEMQ
jgi:hypothetical protein